jgi:GT2 family glycosyltransferase
MGGDPRIGVGVTTLNRRDIALDAVARIRANTHGAHVVVVDDGSDDPFPAADHRNLSPQGIAAAKNKCLELLMAGGAEHIFLFDDDCWPTSEGWWRPYAGSPQHHLSYQPAARMDCPAHGDQLWVYGVHAGRYECPSCAGHVLRNDRSGLAVRWGAGVMLYYSRHAVDTIGGMRREFGAWSCEHWEHSFRAAAAGLCDEPFADVADPALYALDAHKSGRRSSVPDQVRNAHRQRNLALLDKYRGSSDYVFYSPPDTSSTTVCIPWRAAPDRVPAHDKAVKYWQANGFDVINADSDPAKPFLCNQARNNAVRRATSDIVVIADGDTVPEDIEQVNDAIRMVAAGEADVVWPFHVYRHVPGDAVKARDVRRARVVREYTHGSPGGMIVANRHAYWGIGGYDERFVPGAWAWDDTSFMYAAYTLLNATRTRGVVYSYDHSVDNAGQPGRNLDESPNKARYLLYEFANNRPDVMRTLVGAPARQAAAPAPPATIPGVLLDIDTLSYLVTRLREEVEALAAGEP